jgi:hypothetical protein
MADMGLDVREARIYGVVPGSAMTAALPNRIFAVT